MSTDHTSEQSVLSVSQLSHLLNATLEQGVGRVKFECEISELTHASSGHMYLTVKDDNSQLSIVMWRSTVGKLKFRPKIGDKVVCSGVPNLYPKSGRLQIIVQTMKPSGAGELYEKFLRLKKKLTDEGLFEEERKKVLPFLPKKIGIVTSGDGAAIHDMMVQISKRMPTVRVLLVDVRVQGPGSAEEIAEGIELLNSRADTDVIIVGRGGGSLEDLWSFNEEVVVRAIAKSEIPVISAVGHEVDISLSDFVADYRAATPTAAAEVVVPDREILLSELDELEDRLNDTDRWFQPLTQALDELEEGLESAIVGLFERIRPKVELLASKLDGIKPRLLIGRGRESLNQLDNRLQFAVNTALSSKLMKLDGLGGRLESVSHKGVMKRGYSLVRAKGKILRDPSKLRVGEQIDVSFYEGAVTATVDKKTES